MQILPLSFYFPFQLHSNRLPPMTLNLQATFRLEPKVPYNRDKCDLVLKEVIDTAMEEYQYNAKQAPIMCNSLAEEIKKRVKELGFDRCAYIFFLYLVSFFGFQSFL